MLCRKNFSSLFFCEKVCLEMHLFKTKHKNTTFVLHRDASLRRTFWHINIFSPGTKKTIYWSRSQTVLENVQLKRVCDGGEEVELLEWNRCHSGC